jgi:cbb3-type cytochrome oxidase subunit 3
VTFLLFLASLAVMAYLVRKPRKKPDDNPKAVANRNDAAQDRVPAATSMPGLLALGQALEAQGRGEDPGIGQVPQVHGPPVDGV